MTCGILCISWVTVVTMVMCYANDTVIIVGPSGAGKSSLINFMVNKGTEVAKEGATYNSETLTTTVYDIPNFDTKLIDTPGLQDTTGYTNEEIIELIKSALLEQRINSISGVVLMFDATQVRIHLATMIESVIHIFGSEILQKLIIAFNKNDQIETNEPGLIIEHCVKALPPIYAKFHIKVINIKQHVVFIDTKGDFKSYSNILHNAIVRNFNGNGINIIDSDQKLKNEIEKYYQMELKDPNNYRTWIEKIPHSEKKVRTKTVMIKQAYNYQCNCRKHCKKIIFKFNCKTKCGSCIGHRDIPTQQKEEYIDIWYEDVSKSELKYSHQTLRDKARKIITDNIRNKVYDALRQRNNKTDL